MAKNCEAGEGVVVAPRSEGGSMGTREHDVCHLSLLI